jgi:hypothetical protein
MAKLNAKARKKLSASQFALPGSRKYPIPDKRHAGLAKARATQQFKKGKISSSTRSKINAAANRVLKKSKKK